MKTHTLYVHPGNSQCRVYLMPYTANPSAVPYTEQGNWKHIALLNHQLKVVYMDPDFAHLRHELEGQMGGTVIHLNEDNWPED